MKELNTINTLEYGTNETTSEVSEVRKITNCHKYSRIPNSEYPQMLTKEDFQRIIEDGIAGNRELFYEALPLNITNVCNLDCIWCFWREDESFANGNLDFDKFKKILDLNTDQFENWDTINLCSGGEVFKNQDLLKMLEYVKEKFPSKRRWIVTNATYPVTGWYEKCYKLLDRITISIDGASAEVYEKIRTPAKFKPFLRNLKNIVNINENIEIQLAMTVSTLNIHEMVDVVKLGAELKHVNLVWVQPAVITNENLIKKIGDININKMPREEIDFHFAKARKEAEKHGILFGHADMDTFYGVEGKNVNGCLAPWTRGPFTITDYVMPCSFMDVSKENRKIIEEKYNLGNPQEKSLEDIYNSEGFWKFRKDLLEGKTKELCGDCMYKNAFRKEDIRFKK